MMSTPVRHRSLSLALALALALPAGGATAAGKQELLEIRNTILNLVDALVEQGVISQEKAEALKREAAEKAKVQAREEALAAAPVEEPPAEEAGEQVIRVPYVPEFVKDQIRSEVRGKLRSDVVEDVMRQAKTERWGMPDALPEWTRRFSFDGDIRLRAQGDFFAEDNPRFAFLDFERINDQGGFSNNRNSNFLNSSEDRERARLRLRLGVEARVLNDLKTGIRLTTGSEGSAVSTNQTLDNDFGSYEVVLDRAYLKYTHRDVDRYPWLTLWGGRLPNPFFSTDLVWDSDLNLDGAAATFRHNLSSGDDLFAMDERNRTLFATVGAFSLDEVELTDEDKWLFGAQAGADLVFDDQSRLQFALAWYDYHNVTGRRNPLGDPARPFDYTAPNIFGKGNSAFAIGDPADPSRRFGLASDFDILNLNARYDVARFAPVHVIFTADYVQNFGYDADEIRRRIGPNDMLVNNAITAADPEEDETLGYHAKVTVGWPKVLVPRAWQVSLGYKHLQRDAVLAAFTDSDFHLGGTNAEGWILGGRYGLLENTYLNVRYLSANEISGPPLGIDVLQVDLVSEF